MSLLEFKSQKGKNSHNFAAIWFIIFRFMSDDLSFKAILIFAIAGYLEDHLNDISRSAMALGLAHSLSRYKLKFSPDKVDTMIVQVNHKLLEKVHSLKVTIQLYAVVKHLIIYSGYLAVRWFGQRVEQLCYESARMVRMALSRTRKGRHW